MRKVLKFFINIYHFLFAFFSSLFYGHPSRDIFTVGVTGTKGKTTVVEMLRFLCEKAGKRSASLSSLREVTPSEEKINLTGNSMPGRGYIQRFLNKARKEKCEYAFIEVTSQGVVQFRDRFIDWDAGFFLNIHPEHIEAHGSFEKYRSAKVKFFKDVLKSRKKRKLFFINKDDENSRYFYEAVKDKKGVEVIFWSKDDFIKKAKEFWGWDLTSFSERKKVNPWLASDFNFRNAAALFFFGISQGFEEGVIKEALCYFKGVPGRFEFINTRPLVLIDYAHTKESLEGLYKTLFENYKEKGGKIIGVLGSAGGGRDKWKRKEMGKVVARYCDEVILTNEDPFDEDPMEIIKEIEKGIDDYLMENKKEIVIKKIVDRKEALKEALLDAKDEDIVVATGKGSERYIRVKKGEKIPWNEKEIILDLLKSVKNL